VTSNLCGMAAEEAHAAVVHTRTCFACARSNQKDGCIHSTHRYYYTGMSKRQRVEKRKEKCARPAAGQSEWNLTRPLFAAHWPMPMTCCPPSPWMVACLLVLDVVVIVVVVVAVVEDLLPVLQMREKRERERTALLSLINWLTILILISCRRLLLSCSRCRWHTGRQLTTM
jgi:hypothetical protein